MRMSIENYVGICVQNRNFEKELEYVDINVSKNNVSIYVSDRNIFK